MLPSEFVAEFEKIFVRKGDSQTEQGLRQTTDVLSDIRVGFNTRFFGEAHDPLRLGGGIQIYFPSGAVPNGSRSDYDTDGTYRFMARLLAAGDSGNFTYAGEIGIHFRPLSDLQTPGSPEGNEFIWGIGCGVKRPLNKVDALVTRLEISETTAFQYFMTENVTALEGLLSEGYEGFTSETRQIQVKLGVGAGIDPHFGTPDWRALASIEFTDRSVKK